jgi:2-oxoglutarate ferredoxin oxidoreductase subunit beta
MLSRLEADGGPLPLGIFRNIERPPYEAMLHAQVDAAVSKGEGDVDELLATGDTWYHDN